jgi:hypothetical protein
MRTAMSLASHAAALERAFATKRLSGVALAINSPGGSPVQSALLFRRIRQLAEEKGVPVFAFAEDVAASGGYWLALAGDEVYAEEASLLGSIGVVSAGFGVARLIDRLGIERRLHTAGERKSLLDPFLPEDPRTCPAVELQRDIHLTFKEHVRRRRLQDRCRRREFVQRRGADRPHGPGARADRRDRRSALGHAGAVWRQCPPRADRHGAAAALVDAAAARLCRARSVDAGRRSARLARSARAMGRFGL